MAGNHRIRSGMAIVLAAVIFLACSGDLLAQTTTGLVGFNETTCKGGADTLVAIPFYPKPVLKAALVAVPAVTGPRATLRLGANAGLPAGDLAGNHFVRIGMGTSLEGRIYPITANDGSTVTIDRKGESLAGVGAGVGVEVVPMWTLGTLLPASSQLSLHASDGPLRPDRRSELMVFDPDASGEKIVPARKFFVTAQEWHEAKAGYPKADDVTLPPGVALLVRHRDGDADTAFRIGGHDVSGKWSTRLKSRARGGQENHVGIPIPEGVSVADLKLEAVLRASVDETPEGRRDEVRVYSETASQHPEPSAVYFRFGNEWRKDAPGFPVADQEVIPAGAGVVIFRSAGGGALRHWVFDTGF